MPKVAKLITLLGPTASGKTSMAIELAQKYNGEIVCADSRTVYAGMDIGTAKPTMEEQKVVRHHLLGVVEPDKPFSAAEFKDAADRAIADIQSRDKVAFLVGGSGMYIDAVLYDYSFRDSTTTAQKQALNTLTLSELQTIAKEKYPQEFAVIDAKNKRRVEQLIRMGPTKDDDRMQNKVRGLVLGLDVKKPILRHNIAIRTKTMLSNDFIHEVQELCERYGETDILLHTTGYAEVIEYLHGRLPKEDLELAIESSTWQLSRKQMTWFRRNPAIEWVQTPQEAQKLVELYLET